MASTELENSYVKQHYDTQVGPLESYTHERWETTVTGRFDYRQTSRAIDHALGNKSYASALEVGPGDAVWTAKLLGKAKNVHLVEQSVEMLERAKKNLVHNTTVTFERADFMESRPPGAHDVIMAIRCFEYFTDKHAALRKMYDLLRPDGRLVVITKNSDFVTSSSVQSERLHSDQVSRVEMVAMLREAGFEVREVFPATMRWKANWLPSRLIFDVLQRIAVATSGILYVPFLQRYSAESFAYVARRPL